MPTRDQNHQMVAGETKVFTVTCTNLATGALVDFSGAVITWKVKRGSTTVLSKSGSVTGTGIFTITLAGSDTTSLSGRYSHECRATLGDGTVATLFTGDLVVDVAQVVA